MSGLVQGLVWRARLERAVARDAGEPGPWVKPILCRLADEADDDGHDVFPAVSTVALDVGVSEATVQRALRWLRAVDLIRVAGSAAGGRGRATRYWINVGLLGEIQRGPSRAKPVPPPAFEPAGPIEKGCHTDTLSGAIEPQKGVTECLKGVRNGLKGVTSDTLPYTHRPKSARDGQSVGKASPSARSPSPASGRAGQTSRPEAKSKAGADRRLVGDGLVGDGLAKDGLGGVTVPDCPEAARRWANLRRAIWSKQVEALFRTWLPATAIRALRVAADGAGVLELGGFAAKRVAGRPEIGAFLAEQGWRVEVSGAGG
jgi:hypothetical protein